MTATVANPYKKVWDTVDDKESTIQAWANNGTLFVPTREELGRRWVQTAHYLLKKAREHGNTAVGRKFFEDAMFAHKMASSEYKAHHEVIRKSR